ncbi:Uncharacterised protein [[Clostridium] sordellii]|nr:Uncharacterised protein [[Clostridium] sordellii] [Paeniclostridium sordellii]
MKLKFEEIQQPTLNVSWSEGLMIFGTGVVVGGAIALT